MGSDCSQVQHQELEGKSNQAEGENTECTDGENDSRSRYS
jgi:hypothetical protein